MKTSLDAAMELYPPHGIEIIEGVWNFGKCILPEIGEVWVVVARANHEAHGIAARTEILCLSETEALDEAATAAVNQDRDMLVIHYIRPDKSFSA